MFLTERQKHQIIRKQKRIKLKDIAIKVGVTISMLSMYENNKVNLSKEKEALYCSLILQ